MKHIGRLVNALVQDPLGPGFESQVPQNFVTLFLQVLRCSAEGREHHTSSDLNVPNGFELDPKARTIDPPWIQVNASIGNLESQQRPACWAWKKLLNQPPFFRPSAPKVCSCFYFLFIFLLLFIIIKN